MLGCQACDRCVSTKGALKGYSWCMEGYIEKVEGESEVCRCENWQHSEATLTELIQNMFI